MSENKSDLSEDSNQIVPPPPSEGDSIEMDKKLLKKKKQEDIKAKKIKSNKWKVRKKKKAPPKIPHGTSLLQSRQSGKKKSVFLNEIVHIPSKTSKQKSKKRKRDKVHQKQADQNRHQPPTKKVKKIHNPLGQKLVKAQPKVQAKQKNNTRKKQFKTKKEDYYILIRNVRPNEVREVEKLIGGKENIIKSKMYGHKEGFHIIVGKDHYKKLQTKYEPRMQLLNSRLHREVMIFHCPRTVSGSEILQYLREVGEVKLLQEKERMQCKGCKEGCKKFLVIFRFIEDTFASMDFSGASVHTCPVVIKPKFLFTDFMF